MYGTGVEKRATIAEVVADLLALTGMNKHQLAKKAGLPPVTVHRILDPYRRSLPSSVALERILRACGKSWTWLEEWLLPIRLDEAPRVRPPGRPRGSKDRKKRRKPDNPAPPSSDDRSSAGT